MQMDTSKITVVQLAEDGTRSARIDLPADRIPKPGQYLLAVEVDASDSVLGWPLFTVGLIQPLDKSATPFLGKIPPAWGPGTVLQLRGPLGKGFYLPQNIRRLALAALGESASRLLPLIQPALEIGADIAIFSASPLPPLPTALEIQPLNALADSLAWADFLAVDAPLEKLPALRGIFGLEPHENLPCPAQVLVETPMPCAGISACGACAVFTRSGGYNLACKDGPIFDLTPLEW